MTRRFDNSSSLEVKDTNLPPHFTSSFPALDSDGMVLDAEVVPGSFLRLQLVGRLRGDYTVRAHMPTDPILALLQDCTCAIRCPGNAVNVSANVVILCLLIGFLEDGDQQSATDQSIALMTRHWSRALWQHWHSTHSTASDAVPNPPSPPPQHADRHLRRSPQASSRQAGRLTAPTSSPWLRCCSD